MIVLKIELPCDSGTLKASSDLLDVNFLTKEEVIKLYQDEKISPFVVNVLKDFNWIL